MHKVLSQFVVFMLVIYCISANISNRNFSEKKFQDINYSSEKNINPFIHSNNGKNLIEKIEIKLNFINKDEHFQYGNIFQTSSFKDGIRLELQPVNKIVLITGEGHLYLVADNLKSNQLYELQFNYIKKESLDIYLDGKLALAIKDPKILDLKFFLQNFAIGSGYSLTRPFKGEIVNSQVNISYSNPTLISKILMWALLPLVFLGFFISYLKLSNLNAYTRVKLVHIKKIQSTSSEIYLYPMTIIFCAVFLFITLQIGEQHTGLTKWIPYLAMIVAPLCIGIGKFKFFLKPQFQKICILLPLTLYAALLMASLSHSQEFNRYLFLLFALSSAIILISINENKITIFIISLISWLSIYPLLNWRLISDQLEAFPFPYLIFVGITIILIQFFITNKNNFSKLILPIPKWLSLTVTLSIFFFLSFRTDSLFIPGSEYHWEYFVGPIRTIRNGGWLLYDAPSQYGFLNILLASLIPVSSSWQAFYIFQSVILFITSSSILIILFFICRNTLSSKLLILLFIVGAFFFADPEWIGPTPYPSSSVTRFFCCYLLICLSFIPRYYKYRILCFTLGWIVGLLWSAESCFYSTVIYLFYITADALEKKSWPNIKDTLLKYAIYSSSLLILTLIIIAFFYQVKLGHLPNFLSHFDYAIGYASGYGYVPFPLNGPGNMMLLIFIGLSLLMLVSLRTSVSGTVTLTLACASGCIWAIGSYYIGRPVPQNITAMFPLLITCSLIGMLLAQKSLIGINYNFLTAAAFPLFFLILSTFYSGSFWKKIPSFESISNNISTKLFHKSDSLNVVIDKLDPKGIIPKVYLGDSAVSPKFNLDKSEKTWLPTPLQLLMPPISPLRAKQILDRSLCANANNQVILIHQLGSVSGEFSKFEIIFRNHLELISLNKIDSYEVFLYRKNLSMLCN